MAEPTDDPYFSSLRPDNESDLQALRSIVEGTATGTGEEFFRSLARHLAAAMGVRFAFVAVFLGGSRARTIGYWEIDKIVANVEWDLCGTPCEDVVHGSLCHHPNGVAAKFASDEYMVKMGIESYLGVPLRDNSGQTLGHLAVFNDQPMPREPRQLYIFRIFQEEMKSAHNFEEIVGQSPAIISVLKNVRRRLERRRLYSTGCQGFPRARPRMH